MPLHTEAFPPESFAIWIRTLRIVSDMSQDALAAASGVSERTIQRIEASGRANQMTRRSLARGLGYEDHDIFDDPSFIATATGAIAEIQAKRVNDEKASFPDHIKLAVDPVSSGAQITALFDRCDAWVFHCDDSVGAAGQKASAVLFDNIQDYGDIWSDIAPSGRFEARDAFTEMLANLASQGLRAYQAYRSAYLAPVKANQDAVPFNIGYITVFPEQHAPIHILVPKRF